MFLAGATSLVAGQVLGQFRQALGVTESPDLAAAMGRALAWPLLAAFLVSSVVVLTAMLAAAAQGGLIFTLSKLAPDITRLNPLNYFGRIFSSAGVVELLKSSVKIVLIAMVAWRTAQWGLALAAGAHDISAGLAALAAASRRILYLSATSRWSPGPVTTRTSATSTKPNCA